MKKRLLSILCAGVMVTSLAGCGAYEIDDSEVAKDSAVEKSVEVDSSQTENETTAKKIFHYAIGLEPTTLDPNKLNSVTDQMMVRPTQETLVRDTAGKITPGIAESWDISEDGLTYTFHLREAYWSDGVQVTAADFVYSMQRLMNPETGSVYAYIGEDIKNGYAVEIGEADPSELGVTAIDDMTLEIVLEHPTTYFLSKIGGNLQFAPIRQDIVEKYGADFAATSEENVYCGPFLLTSTDNMTYIFEKNEDYWDADSIKLDGCEVTVVSDPSTQFALYESGELDYVGIPSAQISNYDDVDKEYENGAVYYFYIKQGDENSILSNKNFRLALNYGLDRNTFAALATNNVERPANSFVLPNISGVSAATYGEEYTLNSYPLEGDTTKALEYLTLAMEEEGIAAASDITVKLTTYDVESAKKWAEVAQELWQQTLGIQVEIVQVTYSELYGNVLPGGDFEICYGGWVPDYDDPYTYLELFKSDVGYYNLGFVNEEYDALLEASKTETDAQARMDMLNQAEQILLDEAAFIPTLYSTSHYLIADNVSNVEFYFLSPTMDWIYADITQ